MLSNDLKRIYSSAPANRTLYTALVLSNPAWPTPLYLIDNTIVARDFQFDGVTKTFQPSIFTVDLPSRRDESLPELQLSFSNFGDALVDLLELASGSGAPITLLELQLTSVALDADNCTGTAKRVDLINRLFPREVFTLTNYPGLFR